MKRRIQKDFSASVSQEDTGLRGRTLNGVFLASAPVNKSLSISSQIEVLGLHYSSLYERITFSIELKWQYMMKKNVVMMMVIVTMK